MRDFFLQEQSFVNRRDILRTKRSPNIGTREEPLALPVDRANDATASTPRKPHGIPENSGDDDDDEETIVCYPEGVRENVHENTDWGRQGHGSNGELGYPRFALANGRENDVDPSGYKTSGKSSLHKISSTLSMCWQHY